MPNNQQDTKAILDEVLKRLNNAIRNRDKLLTNYLKVKKELLALETNNDSREVHSNDIGKAEKLLLKSENINKSINDDTIANITELKITFENYIKDITLYNKKLKDSQDELAQKQKTNLEKQNNKGESSKKKYGFLETVRAGLGFLRTKSSNQLKQGQPSGYDSDKDDIFDIEVRVLPRASTTEAEMLDIKPSTVPSATFPLEEAEQKQKRAKRDEVMSSAGASGSRASREEEAEMLDITPPSVIDNTIFPAEEDKGEPRTAGKKEKMALNSGGATDSRKLQQHHDFVGPSHTQETGQQGTDPGNGKDVGNALLGDLKEFNIPTDSDKKGSVYQRDIGAAGQGRPDNQGDDASVQQHHQGGGTGTNQPEPNVKLPLVPSLNLDRLKVAATKKNKSDYTFRTANSSLTRDSLKLTNNEGDREGFNISGLDKVKDRHSTVQESIFYAHQMAMDQGVIPVISATEKMTPRIANLLYAYGSILIENGLEIKLEDPHNKMDVNLREEALQSIYKRYDVDPINISTQKLGEYVAGVYYGGSDVPGTVVAKQLSEIGRTKLEKGYTPRIQEGVYWNGLFNKAHRADYDEEQNDGSLTQRSGGGSKAFGDRREQVSDLQHDLETPRTVSEVMERLKERSSSDNRPRNPIRT